MGVYIRDMEKPKSCGECKFFCGLGYGFHCYLNGKHITFIGEIEDFCPLIEIDHTNTELLEFFNEFKKWKASKEVAKYINAVYGERRADD